MRRIQNISFIAAGFGFVAAHSLLSAQVVDPELDFISIPEGIRAEWGILPKDEVKRMDLDLTGDGRATIFLAYQGVGSKAGVEWTAYYPSKNGYVRTFGIQFREDLFRAGKVEGLTTDGGLLLLYPARGGGELCRINIESTGILTNEKIAELDFSNPQHVNLFERVFGRKLGEPMPEDFFRNPPHQLIKVETIEARAGLNSPIALQQPEQLTGSKQIPRLERNPSPDRDGPTVGIPWTVFWVSVVATAGLIWVFLKRNQQRRK